ncbi:RNA polymerase sigma-70 factor [Gaoshiqia sediminis]|uniref:RNA polymerase sigma-70 factor n=1 Tax=Gaoshiqia sediminis TaxID=2986998 RepID=A0AA41YBG3_9BACT|nr:RNA polymerase sigma-70 factor [Gaoshiqia sediminis]MCW0483113.1 RNA polymerase sigma-70 factor [Gaoshiqia sediminis]
MTKNDKQLFHLLLTGDETSFKVVYQHFYPRLYYFVLEYLPHHEVAEDVVHDTFLTLWQKRSDLQVDSNLNAYLYTLAKNNSLKKLRDERYRQRLLQSPSFHPLELELNAGALMRLETTESDFSEIEHLVQATLEQLPPQCRQVFELSRFVHKKNREIADELGLSVKTVEGHITKAIKLFKINLKDYLPLLGFLLVR